MASVRAFLGVMLGPLALSGLAFVGDTMWRFSFDKAKGSGDEGSELCEKAMTGAVDVTSSD